MAFGNDDYESGTYVDASVIYGPTVAARTRAQDVPDSSQPATITPTPLSGATGEGSDTDRPNVRAFFRSPVGWLLVLLALAYIAFDKVFGDGGVGE